MPRRTLAERFTCAADHLLGVPGIAHVGPLQKLYRPGGGKCIDDLASDSPPRLEVVEVRIARQGLAGLGPIVRRWCELPHLLCRDRGMYRDRSAKTYLKSNSGR